MQWSKSREDEGFAVALFFPPDQQQAGTGEKKNNLSNFMDCECIYVL